MLPPSQIIVYLIYSIQIDIFLLVYLLFVFLAIILLVCRRMTTYVCVSQTSSAVSFCRLLPVIWEVVVPGIVMAESVMAESAIPESALPGTAMPGVWMLDTAMPRTLIPGTGPDVGYSRSFIDTIKRQ